ncbi:RNA-binding domain superfamily [Arabidopsis thaliana x Arabidopsis arenosa]|uniref:RNA-binding domain superfamily n=1 Tax=Arabidopsis thaliana x Arabidopsis arenosa TaxID=1240361 RepID=A0A8T1ZMD2_9BRAS|nr:RNA-binding domain superfamily [Arabidopsis thaliana x Arabidopsis arenosa]KAG7560617.1 RNA-binding domain superfamily [Arabidopsis thaliana x Arabidopsis arenosa]KAG7560618.1 RNA-binding domain superfamily [Arabidopsis thaliana x Arabidopsis arenosa]
MSRTRTAASEAHDSMESEERVDLDGDNDPEEILEEEVEYEEVEEEEEIIEEIEEEIEEEVEVEEEEEDAVATEEEEEKKRHAELLALPSHGSEVYLGGIPTDATEGDLKGFCQSIGEVTEVRIMREKESGDGKGYAFVTFRNKDLASKAIDTLNSTEFRGKRIKCSTTQAKHRLFLGNVPRNWTESDIKKAANRIGPGVQIVELPKEPQNMGRNRGFAFIEYHNHACAEYSKQKMSNPSFKLDDNAPTVSWAESRSGGGGDSSASQVKALYIKNLPRDITQERLKALFEHHGKILKVVIPPAKPGKEDSRYGFVHYAERTSVMRALKNTERYEIDGHMLDCTLAKPQADQKANANTVQNVQKSQLQPNYPPLLSYGMAPSPFGALGGFGASAYSQPLMHAGGHAAGGMSMMPIMLPDGRIGYVLQQPGLAAMPQPPPRPSPPYRGGSGSSSSSSSKRSSDNGRGRSRYNPY